MKKVLFVVISTVLLSSTVCAQLVIGMPDYREIKLKKDGDTQTFVYSKLCDGEWCEGYTVTLKMNSPGGFSYSIKAPNEGQLICFGSISLDEGLSIKKDFYYQGVNCRARSTNKAGENDFIFFDIANIDAKIVKKHEKEVKKYEKEVKKYEKEQE